MKYRVSFYRKDEVKDGRAPRYMVDIDADSVDVAKIAILQEEPKAVIRSAYKTPENIPIRETPSFVFLTGESRTKWYSTHKSSQKERVCHECNKNPVEHYKRICKECREKRGTTTEKPCALCGNSIPIPSRRRYCDDCASKRKESQEKFHREKRAKQTTIDRIREQVAWAKEALLTTTKQSCKMASRFQGLRVPHMDVLKPKPKCRKCKGTGGENHDCKCLHYVANENRCRTCLQKFIDVQNVYLANLIVGEPDETETILPGLLENEYAHSAAAGA